MSRPVDYTRLPLIVFDIVHSCDGRERLSGDIVDGTVIYLPTRTLFDTMVRVARFVCEDRHAHAK